jgi:hypothetical protein
MHLPISDEAKNFMTYDYAELKDLCKQFLTLVSGILVFSITFTDKIVEFNGLPRWPLLISWIAFIGAIVLCGLGLGLIALAGGQAVSGGQSYRIMEYRAVWLTFGAGLSFLIGLAALIVAGVLKMFIDLPLRPGT